MDSTNNGQPLHYPDEILNGSTVESMDLARSVTDLTVSVNKALEELAVSFYLLSPLNLC
jgi:hypothetical protein